jgi:flagella basal body P-ring formation protein FlgA
MVSKRKYFLFFLVALLALIAVAPVVAATKVVSGADIKRAVEAQLELSGKRGEVLLGDERLFYPCDSDLTVERIGTSWRTMRVNCTAPRSWSVHVRTSVVTANVAAAPALVDQHTGQDMVQRVVLVQSVATGEILTQDHVKIEELSFRTAPAGFSRLKQVIGRRLKRALSLGQPVQARHLHPDWVIENGQTVEIEHKLGQISVVTSGKALENGQMHDLIEVENLKNGKKQHFFVIGAKKVATAAKLDAM